MQTNTKGRPREETRRRWPSTRQGKRPRRNQPDNTFIFYCQELREDKFPFLVCATLYSISNKLIDSSLHFPSLITSSTSKSYVADVMTYNLYLYSVT